jgi:hypothetical protein
MKISKEISKEFNCKKTSKVGCLFFEGIIKMSSEIILIIQTIIKLRHMLEQIERAYDLSEELDSEFSLRKLYGVFKHGPTFSLNRIEGKDYRNRKYILESLANTKITKEIKNIFRKNKLIGSLIAANDNIIQITKNDLDLLVQNFSESFNDKDLKNYISNLYENKWKEKESSASRYLDEEEERIEKNQAHFKKMMGY